MSLTLAQVNAAIAALVVSPQVDYTEGDVTVKAGQKMTQLLALRKELMQNPSSDETPEFGIIVFNDDVNEFGMRQ